MVPQTVPEEHTGITGKRHRDSGVQAVMNVTFLRCAINYTTPHLLATEGLAEIPLCATLEWKHQQGLVWHHLHLNHLGQSCEEWALPEMEVCFPLHFFPWCCGFPQRDTGRNKPLGAAGFPGRVLPLLPPAGSCRRARVESVSMLRFSRVWLPESKHWDMQPDLFFFFYCCCCVLFFFLICPPDPELKPSIHFTEDLVLDSNQQ